MKVKKFFDRRNFKWTDFQTKLDQTPIKVPVNRNRSSSLRLQVARVMESLKADDKIDSLDDALDFIIGDDTDLTSKLSKHEVAVDFMVELRKTRDERIAKARAPKEPPKAPEAPKEPPKV